MQDLLRIAVVDISRVGVLQGYLSHRLQRPRLFFPRAMQPQWHCRDVEPRLARCSGGGRGHVRRHARHAPRHGPPRRGYGHSDQECTVLPAFGFARSHLLFPRVRTLLHVQRFYLDLT